MHLSSAGLFCKFSKVKWIVGYMAAYPSVHGRGAGHSILESPGKTPLPLQRSMENKGSVTAGGCETLLIFVIFCSLMHFPHTYV